MNRELTFVDLAINEVPFPLAPPFGLGGIPIPIDILDALVSRYLPGLALGWVELEREEVTPVSIKYHMKNLDLGNLGTLKLYKTGFEESEMRVGLPPLSSLRADQELLVRSGLKDANELRDRRRNHQINVIEAMFSLLAKDSTWKKYWRNAGEKLKKEGDTPDLLVAQLLKRIDEMELNLGEKLDDLKIGQAAIYKKIGRESILILEKLMQEIQHNRIDQGELLRSVDAVKRALKYLQTKSTELDADLKETIDQIYVAVNSDIAFNQKLELTLPVIPYLLEYKIELNAGVDLGAVWDELKKYVK